LGVVETLIFGLVTGSILLLGTVGFSMIRRVDNFLNIAHGQMVALGGYFGYTFYQPVGLNFVVATIAAMVVTGVIGWLSYKVVFGPIREHGSLYLLFTSVGLSSFFLSGADVLVYPTMASDWLMQRFRVLAAARAIENQVFVVVVNAIGVHPTSGDVLGGGSLVAFPNGATQEMGSEEALALYELDGSLLAEERVRLDLLADRAPEVYAGFDRGRSRC